MKFLTDRHEIAEAINIRQLPTVRIDIRKCIEGFEDCYEGDKIVVEGIRCTVKMFGDGVNETLHDNPERYKKIELMPEGICLHESFGRQDVEEMVEWRQAQRASAGDEILVLFEGEDFAYLRQMKIGKVAKFVYPTAVLEDIA